VGLLRHRHKAELELRPGLDHAGPLVPDVLQRGGDVDLLGALGHAVEDHVDEDVGAGATNTVTAVDDDGAGTSPVGLVHLPPELEDGPGGGGDGAVGPGEEVELGDRPRLPRLAVLEVERPDQEPSQRGRQPAGRGTRR